MKDLPLTPPAGVPTNWLAGGMLPLLIGAGGYLAAAMMGLYGKKDKKMTKLETACLAFVIAITEKAEELEKHKRDLLKRLSETETKLVAEQTRTEQAQKQLTETADQLSKAKIQITELERRMVQMQDEWRLTKKGKGRR